MTDEAFLVEGWTVTDWPQPAVEADYETGRRDIVDMFSTIPWIKGVIEFGTTPYPGISDLDIYVMVDESARRFDFPGYFVFEGPARRHLTHDFFLLTPRHYRDHVHFLDPWIRSHRILSGDVVTHGLPPRPYDDPVEDRWLRLAHTLNMAHDIAFIADCLEERRVPMRKILDVICYAGYVIREVRHVSPLAPCDFLDRLNEVRARLLEEDRREMALRVVALMEESLVLFATAYDALADYVTPFLVPDPCWRPDPLSKWAASRGAEGLKLTRRLSLLWRDRSLDPADRVACWMAGRRRFSVSRGSWRREVAIREIELPAALSGMERTLISAPGSFLDLARRQVHGTPGCRRVESRALRDRGAAFDDIWTWLNGARAHLSGGKPPMDSFNIPVDRNPLTTLLQMSMERCWIKQAPRP